MRLSIRKAWAYRHGLGQGSEVVKQAPEPELRNAIPHQTTNHSLINGSFFSREDFIGDDKQPLATPLFINNGE